MQIVRTADRSRGANSLLDTMVEGTSSIIKGGVSANPTTIICYPIALGNPFQHLLYSRSFENGVLVTGTNDISELSEIDWPWPVYLHIHWLGQVIGNSESEFVAASRVRSFISSLEKFTNRGGLVIWTVHNSLPHDAMLTGSEVELRQRLAGMCHGFHIMNTESSDIVSDFFDIPQEKSFHTPHPSYAGYYPDTVSREEARFQLGVEPDEFVFLFFGSIQHYKGLGDLVRAYQEISKQVETRCRLIVAGNPKDREEHSLLLDAMSADPSISLFIRRISIDKVQYFFRAADICVCPYKTTLNSGITLLSHSFGTPVLGPDTAAFREILEGGVGLLFQKDNFESLKSNLKSSISSDLDQMRRTIQESLPKYECKTVSDMFFNKLSSLTEV